MHAIQCVRGAARPARIAGISVFHLALRVRRRRRRIRARGAGSPMAKCATVWCVVALPSCPPSAWLLLTPSRAQDTLAGHIRRRHANSEGWQRGKRTPAPAACWQPLGPDVAQSRSGDGHAAGTAGGRALGLPPSVQCHVATQRQRAPAPVLPMVPPSPHPIRQVWEALCAPTHMCVRDALQAYRCTHQRCHTNPADKLLALSPASEIQVPTPRGGLQQPPRAPASTSTSLIEARGAATCRGWRQSLRDAMRVAMGPAQRAMRRAARPVSSRGAGLDAPPAPARAILAGLIAPAPRTPPAHALARAATPSQVRTPSTAPRVHPPTSYRASSKMR